MSRVAIFGLGRSGLAVARGVRAMGDEPVVFDSESREGVAKPGVAFLAQGEGVEVRWDFKEMIPDGFGTLVVNPAVDHRHPMLRDAVERGVEVIGEVEFAYRIAKAPIIAITGTNGKSTTTVMTYRCLKSAGESPVLCGNIFGSGLPEVPLTEAALTATEDQVLVAEISSFQLEWVRDFRPAVAAVTNITPDHLNRYDSFAQYAATKMRLFGAQTAEDYAVLRNTDPVARLSKGYPGKKRSVGPFGDDSDMNELELRILDRKIQRSSLSFRDPYNVTNAGMAAIIADSFLRWKAQKDPKGELAAKLKRNLEELRIAVGAKRSVYEKGLPLPEIAVDPGIIEGIREFSPLEHRMENLGERKGVRIINNSMCTNPAAVVASVQGLDGDAHILLGGENKELDFTPLRQFLGAGRHRVYVYGKDAPTLTKMLGGRWPSYATMENAFDAAKSVAQPGQVIILAPGCASTDGFRDFRERGEIFRRMAKEWLNYDEGV